MYSQIDSNKTKTILLLLFFIVFVAFVTFFLSYAWIGDYEAGIVLAFFSFFISIGISFITYFTGASIVLSTSHAREVTDNPEYRELNERIETLAIKAGIPKPRIYLLPDPALNAFATGRDPEHAHIALTEGILNAMQWPELEAVIAHELGHIKNFDIRLMLIVSVLAGTLTFITDIFFRGTFYGKNSKDKNVVVLLIAIILAILAPIIAAIVQFAISRRREFLADMTSVEITRYPQSMVNALKILQNDDRPVATATEGNAHMYIDFPLKDAGSFLRKLFSTHPPIEERIAAIEKIM